MSLTLMKGLKMTEVIDQEKSSTTATASRPIAKKLEKVFERLNRGLIERDTEIRLAVLGALSGEHLLLIGPPGTAKSEIARRLVRAIGGDQVFERLLTRFSVPEELFGPLSLKALEEDCYERRTESYLPQARVAFIDEIFKANSAILNSLLTILNERKFDNGIERVDVPLVALVGASNELPEGDELQALYDRFLLRRQVLPVSGEGFVEMLELNEQDADEPLAPMLAPEFIEHVQIEASAVTVPREVVEFIGAMRKHLHNEDIYVSDRRWRKALKLLKVAAYTNGQDEVTIWECKLLEHCLWNKPEEQETIGDWYEARIGVDSEDASRLGRLDRVTSGLEALLKKDEQERSHVQDENEQLLYYDESGERSADLDPETRYQVRNADGELLYQAPKDSKERKNNHHFTKDELFSKFGHTSYSRKYIKTSGSNIDLDDYLSSDSYKVLAYPQPVLDTRRYSAGHIESRQSEAAEAIQAVDRHLESLDKELEGLEQRIDDHLWLESSFTETALVRLQHQRDREAELKERLEAAHNGFGQLPREDDVVEV